MNIRFLDNEEVVEVDPGNPVEVRCNVDATPLNASTLTWKRDNFKFGKQPLLADLWGIIKLGILPYFHFVDLFNFILRKMSNVSTIL